MARIRKDKEEEKDKDKGRGKEIRQKEGFDEKEGKEENL